MRLYFKGILSGVLLAYISLSLFVIKEQKRDLDVYRYKVGPISNSERKKMKTSCPKGKKVPKTKPKNPIGFC